MSTTTTAAPSAAWKFADNQFTRNGELIATLENGQPVFTELGEKYRHVVAKQMKQMAQPVAPVSAPAPLAQPPAPAPNAAPLDPYAGLTPAQRECIVWLRKQRGLDPFHVEPRTKKPVQPDRVKGDKSEAFILDVFTHDPVGFCDRYGVVGFGKANRKVMETDPETRRKKPVVRVVQVVLSKRKTLLTERVDAMCVVPPEDDAQ